MISRRPDAIFIFGQNLGTNHPRMLGELRQSRQRGARIISFNLLRERGLERLADPQAKLEMATNHPFSRRSARTTSSCASAATSRWSRAS